MMQISPQKKNFICPTPMDFRKGFNGTAATCRLQLMKNPLDGGLFVFINRQKTMVRFYLFDGHGEFLLTKRIAQGRFHWWKDGEIPNEVATEHVYLLLRGCDPNGLNLPDPWKRLI